MNDTCSAVTITCRDIPKNTIQVIAGLIDGKVQDDCVIHPDHPNKYIQLDHHPDLTFHKYMEEVNYYPFNMR